MFRKYLIMIHENLIHLGQKLLLKAHGLTLNRVGGL